jgi:DNA-binding NtrC family response regulator
MSESPPQVLLVDDDRAFRVAIQRYLVRAGYEVLAVDSGEEALETLRKGQRFEVVITDLRMPGVHGSALIRAVRKLDEHVAIIVLTGDLNADLERNLVEQGAFRCFEKTEDIEILIQAVRDAALESAKWKVAAQ